MRIWPAALLLSACCPDQGDFTSDATFYVPLDALASDLGAQCAELCEANAHHRVKRIDACDIDLVDAGVAEVSCAFTAPYSCVGGRRPHEWVRADGTARGYHWRMKGLVIAAASLPWFAGCNGRQCQPTPGYKLYVDSTNFDDGGYVEQACFPAGLQQCLARQCTATPFDAGVAEVTCGPSTCTGRRPAEVVRASVDGVLVGRWLAEAAQLEAASVPAFEILAAELRAHDAPSALIARALASADDERRHARMMSSLARVHGATPGPVRVVVREPRDLEAIARENAVEGLVREAYGARVAIDPSIGADEQRHAELAADVHAWIRPRLPYAARLRVDEARAAARAQLVAECAIELPRAIRDALGLPDATKAVELASQL